MKKLWRIGRSSNRLLESRMLGCTVEFVWAQWSHKLRQRPSRLKLENVSFRGADHLATRIVRQVLIAWLQEAATPVRVCFGEILLQLVTFQRLCKAGHGRRKSVAGEWWQEVFENRRMCSELLCKQFQVRSSHSNLLARRENTRSHRQDPCALEVPHWEEEKVISNACAIDNPAAAEVKCKIQYCVWHRRKSLVV